MSHNDGHTDAAEPRVPASARPARRTPTFTAESLPAGLSREHRTTVWAELVVLAGSVLFVDGPGRRVGASPDRRVTIVPDIPHHIEPESDAEFYVQFYEADASAASGRAGRSAG